MDPTTNLIFLVVCGLASFIIGKLFGNNLPATASNIVSIVGILPFIIYLAYGSINPDWYVEQFPNFVNLWASNLPGIIIGDVAGMIVAAITGTGANNQ